MASPDDDAGSSPEMRRSYLRVLVVWILTLVGLYALQQYFA